MDWFVSRFSGSVLCASLFLAGCGGGGSDSSAGTPDTPPAGVACQSLSIPTHADALSLVPVSGLGEQLEALFFDDDSAVYAVYSDESGTGQTVYSPLIEDESGAIMLGIPVVPEEPYGSVTRSVELVFGDVACTGFQQTIAGIETGEPVWVDNFIEDYRTAIEMRAAAVDPTLSDWADIVALKDQYVAGSATLASNNLVFILMLADSLETMADTVEDLPEDEKQLLASWMSELGYVDGGGTSVTGLRLPVPAVYPRTVSASGIPDGGQVGVLDTGGCPIVGDGGVNITSAAELNDYMNQQKEAEESLSGFSGDIRQLGVATTPFIGLASGGAGLAAGAALFLEMTYQEYLIHSLPSRLEGLDFEVTPGLRIPEDYELINSNQSAFWSDALVNASSREWNLTGVAIDLISQSIGVTKFFKGMSATPELGAGVKGFVEDGITNEVLNRLKASNPDVECLSVPARTWTNIDVTSDEWTRGDVGPEGVLAPGLRTTLSGLLGLLKTGSTEVYVETLPEKFGGRTAVANKFLQVVPTRLSTSPSFKRVTNPGDTLTFQFNIADTVRPELAPDVSELSPGMSVVSGPTYLDNNQYEIEVQSPTDPAQYPATLTLSREAVLDPMEPRTLQLTVVNNEIIEISPEQACVRTNEALNLTATLEGFAEGTVPSWRVVSGPGTVNGTGLIGDNIHGASYQSAGTGAATVEAWALSSEGEEVVASASVFVGACDAKVHVWHQLTVQATAPGDQDRFQFEGEVLELPARPATFWSGRTEQEGRSVSASGTLEFRDGANTQVVFQQTSGHGIGTWQVDGKGTTTFALDFQGADQCDDDPTEEDSLIYCSNTDVTGTASPFYFVDLDQTRNYQLTMSVECEATGDTNVTIFFLANLLRFDSNDVVLAPNFDPELAEEQQQYPNGQVIPFSTIGQACGTSEGSIDFNEVIRLVGPTTGDTETVVLTIGMIFAAANQNYPGAPDPSAEAVPGSYSGTATINASFDFFPVQP